MILERYRKRLRATVGSSAGPYGYTLSVWTTGAVLGHAQGMPDALDALTFMAGAVLGFALVGTIAFGGLTRHLDQVGSSEAPSIWGSFHFLSVGGAIGAAALVAYLVESFVAWPLGGFLATSVYLSVAGFESAVADEWDHRGEQ